MMQPIRVCKLCKEEVISSVCDLESSRFHGFSLKYIGEGYLDEVCSLCYGILSLPPELLENALKAVSKYSEDTFFVTVHIPDVVYLNLFLFRHLLQTSCNNPEDLSSVEFIIDTKLYSIKETFRRLFCDRFNLFSARQCDLFKVGKRYQFVADTQMLSCLNVVILPPKPNLFTDLMAGSSAKRSAKRMKFSMENGNDLDRNSFLQSANSLLKSSMLSPSVMHELLAKCFGRVSFSMNVTVPSLYIGGRYLKHSRTLSQTAWFIGGKRKGTSSIEELICGPLRRFFDCHTTLFRSSGREDIDVRMLGNGRPFAVELVNPCLSFATPQQLGQLQQTINGQSAPSVEVRLLHVVDKRHLGQLRDGESEKTKEYLAVLFSKHAAFTQEDCDKLTFSDALQINQKTPLRVLHRRTLLDRKRNILWACAESFQPGSNYLTLRLSTDAGTYVKEWVHGDLGRTLPSVCDILGKVGIDIVQLDVANVHLQWPLNVDALRDDCSVEKM